MAAILRSFRGGHGSGWIRRSLAAQARARPARAIGMNDSQSTVFQP